MAEIGDRQEEYEAWLGRLDIPIEQEEDIETLRGYLSEEFGITLDAQVEALWSAVETKWDLGEAGIRGITITYPWGRERRYGVQGLPGLWGWDRIREIMTQEGWWA